MSSGQLSSSEDELQEDSNLDHIDAMTGEAMEEDEVEAEKDDVDSEMGELEGGEHSQPPSQPPADTTALKNAAELFPDDTYLSQSQESEEIPPYQLPSQFDGDLRRGELPPDWDVTVDVEQEWGQPAEDNEIDDTDALSTLTDEQRKRREEIKREWDEALNSETLPPPLTMGPEKVTPVPEPKKPASSWIKFGVDCRAKMKAEGIKLPFKETAAYIAAAFKALSPEEKAKYDEEAAADKARYQKELKLYQEYRVTNMDNVGGSLRHDGLDTEPGELVLPMARIKRIAKFDRDVKNISSEGAVALTKATEMFIQYATIQTFRIAKNKGIKRALRLDDFFDAVAIDRPLEFLKWDFKKPKKPEIAPEVKAAEVQAAKDQAKQAREEAKKSKSSIFNFFGKPKEKVESNEPENSTSSDNSMEVQEENEKVISADLSPTKKVVSETARGWDPEDRVFLEP